MSIAPIGNTLLPKLCLNHFYYTTLIRIADGKINPFDLDLGGSPVHVTTDSQNQCTGISAMEGSQVLPTLTVGDMSYSAGIENVDIGVLIGGYYTKPGTEKFACQRLTLRLVELATYGLKSDSGSGISTRPWVFIVSGAHGT